MSKTKLRIWKWLLVILSYVALFAPITIMIIINRDKYFVHKDGLTVALGGILAVLYGFILIKIGFKKFNKTLSAGMALAIVYCLDSILTNALELTFSLFIGVAVFNLLEIPTNYFSRRLESYSDEEIRTIARNTTNKDKFNTGGRV